MRLRRGPRFAELVATQLDHFAEEERELLAELEGSLRRYDAGAREEAEELYGDHLLAAEACAEALAERRDRYASTLAADAAEAYAHAFDRAAARRWPALAAAIRET